MKVFNLRCAYGHGFEGWFGSAEDFDTQRKNSLLRCPICDSAEIHRLPSAPRLNFGASDASAAGVGSAPHDERAISPKAAQEAARLKALRAAINEVLANTEDVGERFPEEARRIHYHEAADRSIRGVASETERKALEEEGITVMHVPLSPLFKGSLQ